MNINISLVHEILCKKFMYPLVISTCLWKITHLSEVNHHKSSINGQFSIATLHNQRVKVSDGVISIATAWGDRQEGGNPVKNFPQHLMTFKWLCLNRRYPLAIKANPPFLEFLDNLFPTYKPPFCKCLSAISQRRCTLKRRTLNGKMMIHWVSGIQH